MENRVKERLTGAIILVAAVVILVPEMFSGHRSSTVPTTGAPPRPATEGPPLRSYTMERDATTPGTPVAASPTAVGAEKAPAKPVESPSEGPSDGPGEGASEKAVEQGSAELQARAPVTQRAPQATTVAATTGAATTDAGDENFYVQLGSFSKPDNAQRYAQEISRKGFAARVDRGGKGNLLRVRVGPVAGRAAALALREQLAAKGYKGALTAP